MPNHAAAPVFFETAEHFRAWLAAHAGSATELLVGFHKVGSGRPCMSWSESVDQALCHGWIDGVRRRIDDASYSIRFTPRKPGSIWSAVNIAKIAVLRAEGRLLPAGEAAFARARKNVRASMRTSARRRPNWPPKTRRCSRRSPRPGPIFAPALPATARPCCTGSPVRRGRRPAARAWRA